MANQNMAQLGWNEMGELYQQLILDHYRRPRNQAAVTEPDITAEDTNPFCGDEVALQAATVDGIIQHVAIQGQGCSISQASLSMMSDLLKGRSVEEAQALSRAFKGLMRDEELSTATLEGLGDLTALAGVRKYPIRIKCALLAWVALDDGLSAHQTKAAAQSERGG